MLLGNSNEPGGNAVTESLQEAMRQFLESWRDDVPPAWRDVLSTVEPDFAAIKADDPELDYKTGEPIFPGRKGKLWLGAPAKSHMFRALDGTKPSTVRAVVIGQDPYPNITWATGRSFEQGDLTEWKRDPMAISNSLERILAVAADYRSNSTSYTTTANATKSWQHIADDISAGKLDLPPPTELFDDWQAEGVLMLNTALTLTRFKRGGSPHQLKGHIPLWRPVILAIVRHLAERADSKVVFLLWGSVAKKFFSTAKLKEAAQAAGRWGTHVRTTGHSHPSAGEAGELPPFFSMPNPLRAANDALSAMGVATINW